MSFSHFLSTNYPCYENGVDSIMGGIYVVLMSIMIVLYLMRAQNRRAIAKRFFGYQYEDEGEKIMRERTPYKMTIIWHNVLFMGVPHLFAPFGLYWIFTRAQWYTLIFQAVFSVSAALSIPMGAHRLYSHRAFKASRAYEVVIMLFNSVLMQNSIIHWARDHRTHHKFVDTDGDPYNAKRGLFFSHIGWLMVERHPDVIRQGKKIDISDLKSNPVLAFQQRNFHIMLIFFHYILPWMVPYLFWNERFWASYFCCVDWPWALVMTCTGFVNSWSHYEGERPFNKNISPSDGGFMRNFITIGEGYHNYHHTFPQDYRSYDSWQFFNISANLIYLSSFFGLTWDLKAMSHDLVERTKLKNNNNMKFEY